MASLNELTDTLEAKGFSVYYEPAHLDDQGMPASDALYVEVKHLVSKAVILEEDFADEYYAEEALTGFIKEIEAFEAAPTLRKWIDAHLEQAEAELKALKETLRL